VCSVLVCCWIVLRKAGIDGSFPSYAARQNRARDAWRNTPPERHRHSTASWRTLELRNTANMTINATYLAQRTRSCETYARRRH
jgi:hypothetical protein